MTLLTDETQAVLQAAVAAAEDHLDQVLEQQATLEECALQLRQLIDAGKTFLVLAGAVPTMAPAAAPLKATAAELAEAALTEVGRPMSLPELEAYLAERGLLQGKAPAVALRAALRHRDTIFRRVEKGIYGLQAWT